MKNFRPTTCLPFFITTSIILLLCGHHRLFLVRGDEMDEEEEEDEDEYIDLNEMGSRHKRKEEEIESRIEDFMSAVTYIFSYVLTSKNMQVIVTLSSCLPIILALVWRLQKASARMKLVAGWLLLMFSSTVFLFLWNLSEVAEQSMRYEYRRIAVLEYVPKNCRVENGVIWHWLKFWTGFLQETDGCEKFNKNILLNLDLPLRWTIAVQAGSLTWGQMTKIPRLIIGLFIS